MAIVRFNAKYRGHLIEVVGDAQGRVIRKLQKDPSTATKEQLAYLKHVKSVHLAGESVVTPTHEPVDWTKKYDV